MFTAAHYLCSCTSEVHEEMRQPVSPMACSSQLISHTLEPRSPHFESKIFPLRATLMTCCGATQSCMWIPSLPIQLLDMQCLRTCTLLPSDWDQHSMLQCPLRPIEGHQNLGSSTFPPPHATTNQLCTSPHLQVPHLMSPKSRNQRCSQGMTPLNSMDSLHTEKWHSDRNHHDSCLKACTSYGLGRI
jgi:hypothetical protein